MSDVYSGKHLVTDLQQVNDQLSGETFMSTDFSSTMSNAEWDLLVDRGTGHQSAASKWERESLYQKFDPLVSAKERTPVRLTKEEKLASNNARNLVTDLQQVNEELSGETFVSTDFSSTVNNAEWDLLVDRGTGSHSAASKWERESLYQKFDPLVSAKERNQAVLASVENLGCKREQSTEDDSWKFAQPAVSKLISIDTPPPSKTRGRMPVRTEPTQPEVPDSPYNTEDFSEPSPPTQSADALDDETDDSEIQKLRDALEHQARSFHDQLQQRAVQLKEIEATIIAASKKLESQQQSNRVMKEYEKSIATLENEIDRVKRQIAKTSQDRVKIAEERDLAADDLRRAELAFSDLHSKYEKAKQIVSNFKKNEEILMNRYDVMKLKLEHRDAKLKYLQDSVEDVFQRMKMDYESRIKSEDSEGNRIRAQLRKLELRMRTIEKDLEQKEKENSQLSLLCDDLIKGQRN